jgi:predicted SprT family Zn-dependent metalloprotease
MSTQSGKLGDEHELSVRARHYANDVIEGDTWPLSEADVDLFGVVFRTAMSARREHAVTEYDTETDSCTIVVSEKTANLAAFEDVETAIRHELVHVHQFQTKGSAGHGPSFDRWIEPLELEGPCTRYRETEGEGYTYRITCERCGFITGRYNLDKTVRASVRSSAYCDACRGDVYVMTDDGRLRKRDLDKVA